MKIKFYFSYSLLSQRGHSTASETIFSSMKSSVLNSPVGICTNTLYYHFVKL